MKERDGVATLRLLGFLLTLAFCRVDEATAESFEPLLQASRCEFEHKGVGVYAGGELVFLRARPSSSEAFTYEADASADLETIAFNFNYHATPRVWLGVETCDGLGFRARYLFYEDGNTQQRDRANIPFRLIERKIEVDESRWSNRIGGNLGGPDRDGLVASTTLRLQALDVEATKLARADKMSFHLAGGLRYGTTDSSFYGEELVKSGFPTLIEEQFVTAKFRGLGPTFAVDARRPCFDGHLAFKSGLRTSVLVGEFDFVAGPTNKSFGNLFYERLYRRTDEKHGVFIGEVTLGVDWSYPCGIGTFVLGAGWEGQYWGNLPISTRMGGNFDEPGSLFADGFSLAASFHY